MGSESEEGRRPSSVERAAGLVSEALDILDAHGGPADAAAHLDLALGKLREHAASGMRSKS